jgi:transposase
LQPVTATDLGEFLEPLVATMDAGLIAADGVGAGVAGSRVTASENYDQLTPEATFVEGTGS